MNKEDIEARLKQVERRIREIREEMAKDEPDPTKVGSDAYWAQRELQVIVNQAYKIY